MRVLVSSPAQPIFNSIMSLTALRIFFYYVTIRSVRFPPPIAVARMPLLTIMLYISVIILTIIIIREVRVVIVSVIWEVKIPNSQCWHPDIFPRSLQFPCSLQVEAGGPYAPFLFFVLSCAYSFLLQVRIQCRVIKACIPLPPSGAMDANSDD